MNAPADDNPPSRELTLVMSLAEAEDLIVLLDDVCCAMRGRGRPDEARVELTVEVPRRRRRVADPDAP